MTNKINKAIIYDQFGIDVLCARKLKEIISPIGSKQIIGEEIFICDKDKAYGTIILNEPMQLDESLFKNHFSRHAITEEGRESLWPGINKFNTFSFRITKIFKEPLEYSYKGQEDLVEGKFVEEVEIVIEKFDVTEYEEKYESFKNTKCSDEDSELKDLFLDLYKLFTIRLSEKSKHDPAEDKRRRAAARRKKKPKKIKCYNCESYFDYGSQKEVYMGAVACPICEAIINQEGKTLESKNA